MLTRLVHALIRWVIRRDLRKRVAVGLDGVYVEGLDAVRALAETRPVLLAANHVAWWDSALLVLLSDALGLPWRFVMDAKNLRRVRYFTLFGAIGLERGERAAEGLAAGRAWLSAPGRLLWFFPQGRQRPAHLRPLDLKRGVEAIAAAEGVAVVPVVFAYAFRERPEPAAYVRFGAPLPPGATVEAIEAALLAGLDATDLQLEHPEPSFVPFRAPPRERNLGDALLRRLWRLLG